MKKWFYIIIILLITGIAAGFFLWKITVSPQYSLRQLEKAMGEQDVTAFSKYVDLDTVVDSMIVQTWDHYASREETGSRWREISNEISSSLLFLVKPNIKEIIKREVLQNIATGNWSDSEVEDEHKISSLIIRMVKDRIDPGEWNHQSINYTEIEGEIAHVGLTYYDQDKETNFLVELKMRDMKGFWQVIEITNITQLLNMFQKIDDI